MRVACLILLILSMAAPSCKKYKPAPAAFHIKAAPLGVSPSAGQGTSSHNISDLWLYVNNQFIGAYPSDAVMPVPFEGKRARINIFAGIKNNGIARTRIPWVFYDQLQLDTIAAAGSTLSLPMVFRYSSTATFTWTENFDQNVGSSLRSSPISDTGFVFADQADSFEGRSIKTGLKAPHIIAQLETAGSGFALPAGNSNVYLEINYKCNHVFSVGLMGDDQVLRPVVNVNPQQEWNKIYIQLAEAVNTPMTSSRYKVYFRMLRSESEDNLELFLDNIKLVYL